MDEKLLDKAIEAFKELDLNEIILEENGSKVVLKKAPHMPLPPHGRGPAPMAEQGVPMQRAEEKPAVPESDPYSHCKEIKAPLVGVFYAAKSPESQPFVTLGSKVKKGDVVCILEAMKMMNEIRADSDGTILDICAENGSVVEYGQTLFKLG